MKGSSAMLISHTKRFAFIHVPKTGGCSVKLALEQFADDVLRYRPNRWLDRCGIHVNYFAPWPFKRFRTHTPAAILQRELPPDVYADLFTFAFVRNPWDLLVSSYHFLRRDRSHRRGRLAARLGSFARYIDYELHRGKLLQSRMLTSRHGRLLVSGRNQRLAVEELANRMEFLHTLPPADRDAFLAAPAPSLFAAAHLPGATLTAVADAPDAGLQRIELAIEWNEPGRRGHPLRLAGWVRSASGEGSP